MGNRENTPRTSSNLSFRRLQRIAVPSIFHKFSKQLAAVNFWGKLTDALTGAHPDWVGDLNGRSAATIVESLLSCDWFLHADVFVYVNIFRLQQRLSCLSDWAYQYLVLSPSHTREWSDEGNGGYLLSRKLLLERGPSFWTSCFQLVIETLHSGMRSIGSLDQERSGTFVGLCLKRLQGLSPVRMADPISEVFVPNTPFRRRVGSCVSRFRGLVPAGHCGLVCGVRSSAEMHFAHHVVTGRDPRALAASGIYGGCFPSGLNEPDIVFP